MICRWQDDQFNQTARQISDCEENLKDLLTGYEPLDQRELEVFQDKKKQEKQFVDRIKSNEDVRRKYMEVEIEGDVAQTSGPNTCRYFS